MLSRRAAEARQRRVRTILLTIILITLPLYCLGLILWASAPQNPAARQPTQTPDDDNPTTIPITSVTDTPVGEPSITPLGGGQPPSGGFTPIVVPTDPPSGGFPTSTRILSPTPTRPLTATPTTPPPPTAAPPTATTQPPPVIPSDTPEPLPFDPLGG